MTKGNASNYSEDFSADDAKQMEEMKALDSAATPEPELVSQPEPEPEPEPAISSDPIPEARESKNTMVPHAALHEEREARKAAEKEARELKEQFARFDERQKVLVEMQQKPVVKEERPDPDKDAIGALKYTQREIESLRAAESQRAQQAQQHQQINQITYQAANMERDFISRSPDYAEASNFILNSRFNELKQFGLSDDHARNTIEQEKFAVAAQAIQNGKNPAEIIYNLAKARGFSSTPKADDSKIANIASAQKANVSLSNVSGTSGVSRGPSAKEIANMSEEDFTKYARTLSKSQQRIIFGD